MSLLLELKFKKIKINNGAKTDIMLEFIRLKDSFGPWLLMYNSSNNWL
jgi:hypothetical protein